MIVKTDLSERAVTMWAKVANDGDLRRTPLHIHMRDSANVCVELWKRWVPECVRKRIATEIMTTSLFRRDELWMLERTGDGTAMMSLDTVPFKGVLERAYLSGGLPGAPHIKDSPQ